MPTISEKELSFIQDQMTYEQLLVKKYNNDAAAAMDTELQQRFQSIAARHQTHFDQLKSFLTC